MPALSTTSPPTKRPPRRLRFSLRLLLATLTLLCLALGWWTHRAREQRQIVQRIQDIGGRVVYDYQLGFDGPTDSWQQPRAPQWLLTTLGHDSFHYVRHVSLHNVACDRSLIADVARLVGLIEFKVYVEQLTDDDLAPIAAASSLETLCVDSSHNYYHGLDIGDRSLELIGQLPALKSVSVDGRGITKQGLRNLARGTFLESVTVHGVDDDLSTGVDNLFCARVTVLCIWRTLDSNDGHLGILRLP